ncbi:hypothetical protein ABPG72_014669 [Tetrahymena utriculariae]
MNKLIIITQLIFCIYGASQMQIDLNKLQIRKDKSVYVGKSWEDLQNIQNAGQNVLMFHYVSSCSSCKIFLPIYEKVAQFFEKEGNRILFAKIDVMSFHKKIDQQQIKQYPSIQFYNYGKLLNTFEGEREYESLISFVKQKGFPLNEIITVQMFEDIYIKEQVFSIFLGDKSSLQFQEYEFTCSRFGDMVYYFIDTSKKDQEQLKEYILNQFNEYHSILDESIILLVNQQYTKNYFIFDGHFAENKIEEFFLKNAYSQIDILNQRNLNKLLQKNADGLLVILDESQASKQILSYLPYLSLKFNDGCSFFTVYRKNIEKNLLQRLKSVIVQKELSKNTIQLFFIRQNGKQVFQMENVAQDKINQQQLENFIVKVFNGDLPKLVESEEVPSQNLGPIKNIVGKNFEQEVYKNKKDVIVYFKSNFIKESESLIANLLKLDEFIKQQQMEDFIQIFQIDMTKNKIYNVNELLLEDIEVLPKLYIFIADDHKQNGIKLNGKDSNYLKNVLIKISSYDWSNKSKKTQKKLEDIRLNIQKFINPNNVKNFDRQIDL